MNFFRRFSRGSEKKTELVSNEVSKANDKADSVVDSLKSNTQDLIKIAPPAKVDPVSKPSIVQRFGLWGSKRNVKREVAVELVSFNGEGINSLVVDDKLMTIKEAKLLLESKSSEYKDTNLEVVLKSLDFGANIKEKEASGKKIGSKLYYDDKGQVFSDKARTNAIARIGSDKKYIEKAAQDLADLKSGISIEAMKLDSAKIALEISQIDNMLPKIANLERLNPAHKTKEIEALRSELNEASIKMKNVLSELIIMDEQVSSNTNISIRQLAFLDTATNEESIDQLSKLVSSLHELEKGPDFKILDKLFRDSGLVSSEKQSELKRGLIEKDEANNNPEIRAELIRNLLTLSKSFELKTSDSISDIGDFIKDYANVQSNWLSLQASGNLSSVDNEVFAKVNKSIAKNAEILINRYTEKLQDLDYQHDTTHQSNLKHELEFLRGVSPIIPELDHARDICSNLVDFAEQIGLQQEGQMSALSTDIKSKILKHYDAGTLARPQSESFEEATKRDKSQQVFYSRTLLNSINKKLTYNDGSKNMSEVSGFIDPVLSGDYKMVVFAASSLKNPKDLSGALLDDYTLQLAEVGAEIAGASKSRDFEIEKTKINLEHKIRTSKRSLVLETGINLNSLDSLSLSGSIKAMKDSGLDAKFKNLDLLFVNASLCEIKLATLEELGNGEDKSKAKEEEIFERRVNDFIKSTEGTKLNFEDNLEFKKMNLNPKFVEQADTIMAIANTGFSDFKTLNKSVQSISVTAKMFSSDEAVRDVLVQQFMSKDVDLLSRELQSNAMTKLFDVGHVSKAYVSQGQSQASQMSMLLDSQGLKNKIQGFYQQSANDIKLERRSAELQGIKVGRFLTNITLGSASLKSPDDKNISISKVGDAFAALNSNNQALKSELAKPESQQDADKITKYKEYEKEILGLVSGNIKSTAQLTHMSVLYGYDQFKVSSGDKGFAEYLDELNRPGSSLRSHLETKFEMTDNAKTLLDTQIRALTYMEPAERMGEMLEWYNDIHLLAKDKELKIEVDKKSALVGEAHIFSGIDKVLEPMQPGDEFIIDKTGKLTVKNDQEFVNLAQEALTEGAIEVRSELSAIKKDGLKVVKEENGYSVLITAQLGAEFGLGMSTAMGLAESKLLMSGGVEKGHKIKFGNSSEQKAALHVFLRTVFFEPEVTIEDLSRAEAIFIENGKEAKIGVEASIGLPSIINSIAVATGYMPKDERVTDVRDEHLGTLSASLRIGENASASKKITRETRRGEKIVTQSYRSEKEFVGIEGMDKVLRQMGVAESSLSSHYAATSKTTEKFGIITDHTIRTEMSIKTSNSELSQLDRSMLALSGLLKGSYEHDIFMNDPDFKNTMETKLADYKDEMPTVIVERKLRQDVLEELHGKVIDLMDRYDAKQATKEIAKITEATLNNPDNIEISRVLIRSEQSKLRSETFKTTEVKVQTSDEVTVNRRALEEAREAKLAEAREAKFPKPTTFRNPEMGRHNSGLSK